MNSILKPGNYVSRKELIQQGFEEYKLRDMIPDVIDISRYLYHIDNTNLIELAKENNIEIQWVEQPYNDDFSIKVLNTYKQKLSYTDDSIFVFISALREFDQNVQAIAIGEINVYYFFFEELINYVNWDIVPIKCLKLMFAKPFFMITKLVNNKLLTTNFVLENTNSKNKLVETILDEEQFIQYKYVDCDKLRDYCQFM